MKPHRCLRLLQASAKPIVCLAFCSAFLVPAADAAVIVAGPTNITSGTIQFTDDIVFTITLPGSARYIVFDNWVSSDGSTNLSLVGNVAVLLNGSPQNLAFAELGDNFATSAGDITPGDGYLDVISSSLVAGDTLTILAGTYTLDPVSGFNPQASQTFTGNMFITNGSSNRISNIVAVPEPSGAVLFGAAGMLALLRRRRA